MDAQVSSLSLQQQQSTTGQNKDEDTSQVRAPVITSTMPPLEPSGLPFSVGLYRSMGTVPTMRSMPPTASSVVSTIKSWKTEHSSRLVSDPNPSPSAKGLPRQEYQKAQSGNVSHPNHQQKAKIHHQESHLPDQGRNRPHYTPKVSSAPSSLSSGFQRSGNSVITSKAIDNLLQAASSSLHHTQPAVSITVNTAGQQQQSDSLHHELRHLTAPVLSQVSPAQTYQKSGHQPNISSPQSIEEALEKLDAELQGHMQAEERRKEQEEEKKKHNIESNKLKNKKLNDKPVAEKLETFLSNSATDPPPPCLSPAITPSTVSPPTQISPPFPWLSRGGVPTRQLAPGANPVERSRPPPLTPQTDYAREKQRQREQWNSSVTPTSRNTPGIPTSLYSSKPVPTDSPNKTIQITSCSSKVFTMQKSSHNVKAVGSVSNLSNLREPPKLYQAFPKDTLPSSSPKDISPANHQKKASGGLGSLGNSASSSSGDSDSAQFEEEPSELLPDGLANIMKMLDESIKKEEELYSAQSAGQSDPELPFSLSVAPIKSYSFAPDLMPALKQTSTEDYSPDTHASPPVLSRQGSLASPCSRTSSLEEEEDTLKMIKKSKSTVSAQPQDSGIGITGSSYRHSDLAKLYGLSEGVKSECEEEEEETEQEDDTPSCSPPPMRPHLHQTGVNSMFKNLASMLESQKYAYRGGPFGRPPPSALVGVKYSSSLSLGPDICRQQSTSPTSGSTNHPGFSHQAQPSMNSTSEHTHPLSPSGSTPERKGDAIVCQSNLSGCEEEEGRKGLMDESPSIVKDSAEVQRKPKLSTISESSLAELSRSCDMMLNRKNLPSMASSDHIKKQMLHIPEKDRKRERDCNQEKKHKRSSKKHEERKEKKKKHREKQENISLSSSSSGRRHKEGKPHKERRGHIDSQKKQLWEKEREGEKKKKKEEGGEKEEWVCQNREKSFKSGSSSLDYTSSSPVLGSADFQRLKALTDGPPKELKIRLIKVESGDRETFIASEVEEKRIPLEEITIKNTASEIIRSCK